MGNEQNLRPIRPGELSKEEAKKRGKKGGIASGEARRKKKLLRDCLNDLLAQEYDTKNGKITGSELLSAQLMQKALKGDVKAFEVLRDTAGEKPVDKVMVADVDKSVIDEVEEMVTGETD
jgi:hypothetical protein